MKIVTFNHIIEINGLLVKEGLEYKIHLRDACGGQSMWIESLNPYYLPQGNKSLYKFINDYFKDQGMELDYSDDLITFWVKD